MLITRTFVREKTFEKKPPYGCGCRRTGKSKFSCASLTGEDKSDSSLSKEAKEAAKEAAKRDKERLQKIRAEQKQKLNEALEKQNQAIAKAAVSAVSVK